MALPLSHVFPTSASSSSSNHPKFPQSNITYQIKLKKPTIIKFTPYSISITKDLSIIIPKSTKESTNNTNPSEAETLEDDDKGKPSNQDGQLGIIDDEASQLGAEIKKALKGRAEKEPGFLSGVAEEIGEIEWPAFGKVLGTTGVVLGVIAGSSVVLLTVNAVLAELSDRVFAGKGVQDFFS